jgi:hypothetical protein
MPEDDFDIYGEIDAPMPEQNEVRVHFIKGRSAFLLTRARESKSRR